MKHQIRILHLEDNDLDAELVKSQIESEKIDCEIFRVANKQDYIDAINNREFDIIISDNALPDYDGIAALKFAKSVQPKTPFVFLSGTIGEDRAIEALRYGASDYVLKQKMSKLAPAIHRLLKENQKEQEIQRMHEQIVLSEKQYRILTENLPDIVARFDRNFCHIYVNQAVKKVRELPPEAFIGKTNEETGMSKDNIVIWNDALGKVFRTANPQKIEFEFDTPHGTKYFSATLAPEMGEDGSVNTVLSVTHDITEEKQAQKEILKAKEIAEEMNKLKSCFLSNMSHELRTPMVSILGFAQMLQLELKDPGHLEIVGYLIDGGTRLNNTLNSLLELSKIESNNSKLELKLHDLFRIIDEQVNLLKPVAEKKGLYLKSDNLDRRIKSNLDKELFGKALFNIIDNAIKFTKTGGVTIQLSKGNGDGKEYALIKIIDTGVGISGKNLETIFAEFRQASEGLSRNFEGTGIGLTISKKIIELIGGQIFVESRENEGSMFTIKLPAFITGNEVYHSIPNRTKTLVHEPERPEIRHTPIILLVEDNSSNRLVAKLYLKGLCVIDEVVDGSSAIELASNKYYDVILMDINLGIGIDGVETMRRIREIPGYKDAPIIAVTAYVMSGDKEKFLQSGFSDYIPKPYLKDSFLEKIRTVLRITK